MRSAAIVTLALAACTATEDEPSQSTDTTDTTASCGPVGAPEVLAEGFTAEASPTGTQGTEGVAFAPDGTLYVSARDRVVTVDPDGTVTDVAPVGGTIGIVWWRGALWVTSNTDDAGEDDPALVEISPEGDITRHPVSGPTSPNFLTPTPWGTLLVSQPVQGGTGPLYEYDPGTQALTVWADGIPSPNGMVFSPDLSELYVAHTFSEPGLSSIAVDGEAAGDLTSLVRWEGGAGDGVALGADGTVFFLNNTVQSIDTWKDGTHEVLVEEVPWAASIAFARGPGWDPCEAVVTNLFGSTLTKVRLGTTGAEVPGEEG